MDNLYIIESPLQALCALEISLGKKNESHAIIARISSGYRTRNDLQILNILEKRTWDYKNTIKHSSYSNPVIMQFENLFFLFNIEKTFKGKITNLYLGEFRSPFMHMAKVAVKADSTYLLDDGAVSIKVIRKYIDKGLYYPSDTFYPSKKLYKTAFKIIYSKYLDFDIINRNIQVLTAFTHQNNKNLEKISFENIKSTFNKDQVINNSIVYYFGSKYSEAGILDLDYEILFLKSIKEFYEKINKKVVYFAHRDESDEKLKIISKELSFEIRSPTVTAEYYLLDTATLPSEVAGAYTSILNNVKVIFPEVTVRSFQLDLNRVSNKGRKDIKSVYDYFKEINIEVQ